MESLVDGQSKEIDFVFPCSKKDANEVEVWEANPLLHLDSMMRPHVLTRVKEHDFCEYTRFRAEANAVVRVSGGIVQCLPEPTKSEYVFKTEEPLDHAQPAVASPIAPHQPQPSAPSRELSMSEAIEAIRSEDYEAAIEFFYKLTCDRPTYHIGWLRLGYARRERAVRIAPDDKSSGISLLKLAVQDLEKAAQHIDPEYKALGWYERSKSWYHLARLEPNVEEHRTNCVADAEKAFSLSDEKKFLTWLEHLQHLPMPIAGNTES